MGYMEPDFMTEDEKASIQTVTTNDVTVSEGVYTIGGAKVANTTNNLKKGVYVANGRKVVIR